MGQVYLQSLKEVMLNEGLVRNLRDGKWLQLFEDTTRPWHARGKELLKKLVTQGRLRLSPSTLTSDPISDQGWCLEALASHAASPLDGIVATRCVTDCFPGEASVASIDRLVSAPWWTGRSPSVRISRVRVEYEQKLRLVLQCANSIMFIDPHLEPTLTRYRDFTQLLLSIGNRRPATLVESHRGCYTGSGQNRQFPLESDWRTIFQGALSVPLRNIGLTAEVFIWDDFHDRYVISDLIGISAMNGFDTTSAVHNLTTWTRLGRTDRDDIQREFDPACNRHGLKARFKIPG